MHGALVTTLVLVLFSLAGDAHTVGGSPHASDDIRATDTTRVEFLALGDVNLGRRLGRILLTGDTLHPFIKVADAFARHDVVFANLECPISEQGDSQNTRGTI